MSQNFHQGIFSFSNGFERAQQDQEHIAQQIRRDKMRLQGFEPPPPLVAIGEVESSGLPGYEAAGMLSEMFNFPSGANSTGAGEWYGNRQPTMVVGGGLGPLDETKDPNDGDNIATTPHHHHHVHLPHHHHHQISGINADSAAAMQLFLMNPQPPRSSSPSLSSHHPPTHSPSSSNLHMLLPTQGYHHHQHHIGGQFGHSQFTPNVESQGLSLSLSTSLQHLESNKSDELRMGDGGMLFFNHGHASSSSSPSYKNLIPHQQAMNNMGHNPQAHVGFGSSLGVVNVLRNSKYAKAAQDLLEEFCSVGRGQLKKNKLQRQESSVNPNFNSSGGDGGSVGGGGGGGGNTSSPSKDVAPLSAADRLEHQRRKVKLLSMLDEVDKRYNHYCEQMQMVVNSFDLVMGFGAAVPYTALAQKAMSRHFRCLKDAIAAQLKNSCELLGEKDAGTSGITKGETPRLRLLEQSLRQQRAFHQMGMMEQEAWRPQRGLPERSVNILRAWLFEHFLHPYPSDADKHLLARQTGLSRNQVSNWFINARVRLWKPMVEEMYQQESKDHDDDHDDDVRERETHPIPNPNNPSNKNINAQTPMQNPTIPSSKPTPTSATTTPSFTKRSEFNDSENDPSLIALNRHLPNNSSSSFASLMPISSPPSSFPPALIHDSDFVGTSDEMGSTLIRFGTNSGDVSLTLGLRHAGNLPETSNFGVRDFGGC